MAAALGIEPHRDPRLVVLRRQQRPHDRPPARRGAAGAQPRARRGAGLRPGARALRRLLQPALGGAPRGRHRGRASPSASRRSSAARSPTASRCTTPSSCCATPRRPSRRRSRPPSRPTRSTASSWPPTTAACSCAPFEVCGYDDPEQPDVDGRGDRRLRRRAGRLEHEGRVLRRRLLASAAPPPSCGSGARSSRTPAPTAPRPSSSPARSATRTSTCGRRRWCSAARSRCRSCS